MRDRTSAREAAAAIDLVATAFWLHLDLDVLRIEELAAVDYPQPGGLTWQELREVGASALTAPGCAGVSIVIYNPDKDQDGRGAEQSFASLRISPPPQARPRDGRTPPAGPVKQLRCRHG